MTLPTTTPLRAAIATAAAACALLLASCSSDTGQSQSQGAGNTSTTEASSTPLTNLEPCSTLTDQQKKQLNITEPGDKSDEKNCDWKPEGNILGVSLYQDMPLEEIGFSDSEEKQETQVDGRKALLVKGNTGSSCSLAFAVTENSSVSLNSMADTPGDTATACDLVQKAAPLVEQNIPEN